MHNICEVKGETLLPRWRAEVEWLSAELEQPDSKAVIRTQSKVTEGGPERALEQ